MGIAGLVLGICAIAFAVLVIFTIATLGRTVDDQFSNFQHCIDHPHDPICRDPRVP
jgi:uncharacterized protein YoxC